jgi:hypothetical protein
MEREIDNGDRLPLARPIGIEPVEIGIASVAA